MKNVLKNRPCLSQAWIKPTMGAAIIAGLLMGCQKSKNKEEAPEAPQTKIVDIAAIKDADGLANAGEQLMSPYSFMYAHQVFEQSLQKDPDNKKAQFYKAFLEGPMSLQGLLTRIRPLAASQKKLGDLENFIAQFPESGLKTFLLEIKDPAVQFQITENNYQDFYVAYRDHLNNWRKFLKNNHDLKLTLNLNPEVYKTRIADNANKACVPQKLGETTYKIECDFTKIMQVEVGEADIIAIQQSISGLLFYYSIPTSYDWKILTTLSKQDRYKKLSPSQMIELIHGIPSFAPLRKDNSLALLEELGSDLTSAFRWAMDQKTQQELCPNGQQDGVRKGQLFENGYCVGSVDNNAVEKILATTESLFQGPTSISLSTDRGMHTTVLDFSKWKSAPPKDLRIFVPTQLNRCGRPSQFLDASFAGILPNQDWYNLVDISCSDRSN